MELPPLPEEPPRDPVLGGLRDVLATMVGHADAWRHKVSATHALGLNRTADADPMDEVMRAEIASRARDVASRDPDVKAPALRYLNSLRWLNMPESGDPDELFLRQPLSGNEALGCILDIVGGLPPHRANYIRRSSRLPQLPAEERRTDIFEEPLTRLQESAMSMVVCMSIFYAQNAIRDQKLVDAAHFQQPPDGDELKTKMTSWLADGFEAATEQERRDVVEWAHSQLPRLMRKALQRHELAKERLQRDTDNL